MHFKNLFLSNKVKPLRFDKVDKNLVLKLPKK